MTPNPFYKKTNALVLASLNHRYFGYILALMGAFLFATKGIFIKLAYQEHIDSITLLTLRLVISCPVFVTIGLWGHVLQKAKAASPQAAEPINWLSLFQAGLVGALGYWFSSYTDFLGLKYLSVPLERLILFTYPLFVFLLGAVFMRHRINPLALGAFFISYLGLGLVVAKDLSLMGHGVILGSLWCLASAVGFAGYLLLAKPFIKTMGPLSFTSLAMLGAGVATFVQFLLHFGTHWPVVSPRALVLSACLAFWATICPIYFVNFALKRISSQANAVIGFVNPVLTLGLSALFLKEAVGWIDIIGTVCVLSGVGLYSYLDANPAPKRS